MSVEVDLEPASAHERPVSGLLPYLSHLAEEASSHDTASLAPRTRVAYESDWRQWERWCHVHEIAALPVNPELVRLYVTDLASQVTADGKPRFKVSSIDRHLASLAWRSRTSGGIHDLAKHPLVSPVMAGIRRTRAEKPRRSLPLLRDDVAHLITSMNHDRWPDGIAAARDTLALLLGFAGALRRSEVAAQTVADVVPVPSDGLHVHLGTSKTDQDGTGAVVAIPYGAFPVTCGPCARTRWLRLLNAPDRPSAMRLVLATGPPSEWEHVCRSADPALGLASTAPLLRQVPRSGAISEASITGGALNQMLKRRLAAAGWDPAPYGFHSLRAGFVTQARRNGAESRAVRRQTRHASDATVDIYDREYLPLLGNAVEGIGL